MGNFNSTSKSSFLSQQSSNIDQTQLNQDLTNHPEKKNEFLDIFKKSKLFSSKASSNELDQTSKIDKEDLSSKNSQSSLPYEFKNPLDEETIRNPGIVEDLNKLCKEVFPVCFDGCRIIFNKGLSNHFQISHTINMGNTNNSGYRFGATYVGTKMYGFNEAYPILLGDIDPSGNLNANIIHQITPRIKGKFVAQFQDYKCIGSQMSTDYKGNTYTASCILANLDIVNKSGIIMGHYLQNITPKLDLGAELVYQKVSQMLASDLVVLSLLGRYKTPSHVISGSLQAAGFNVCYYKKIDENFQVGVELNTNIQESVAAFGYQLNLPNADLNFKGSINSNFQVCGVLEKKLQPLPLTFLLSGQVNHSSKQPVFNFGLGLMLG